MSTFVGEVKEIPFISVDYFDIDRNPKPQIYFLSHFHTDHMTGLKEEDFQNYLINSNAYIYASPITISYLKVTWPGINTKLQELEVGERTFIKYNEEGEEKLLQVTTIPAGHCPGSVMFFFENDLNILCTGDFRLSRNELVNLKCFKTDLNQTKIIHSVYLDSTFLSEDYKHFPSMQQSADAICGIIQTWLDQNSMTSVGISQSANYGPEYLLIEIGKRLGKKIHVSAEKFLYQYIPDLDNLISTKLDDYKYRIHSFISNKYCCGFPDALSLMIRVSAMIWKNYQPDDCPVKQEGNHAKVCASFHASCSEIEEFLCYLKPENVHLCVVPRDDDTEKEKQLLILEKIMSKYKLHTNSDATKPLTITKLRCDKFPKRTISSTDLLSSPPREFKARRFYL